MSPKNLFRKSVAVIIAMACLWGFFSIGKSAKQRWIVYKTLHSKHWQERVSEIEKITPGKYKIIFFGNSLTELFYLDYYFKDSTLLNCGIVGDFTEGLVKRAGSITRLKPEKLFIEIGINDMIEQIPLGEISRNYEEVIRLVRKKSPGTKIYIQSNLPVIMNRPSIFTGNERVNALIKKQNEYLKKMALENECIYIDIYSAFIKEKDLGSLFIWDGIHFTPKAYEIWTLVLQPYVSPPDSLL